jgi:pentatricopeptide repeat protein
MYACKVFDYMEEPNLVSYNYMLHVCVRIGEIKMAHQLSSNMPQRELLMFPWAFLLFL